MKSKVKINEKEILKQLKTCRLCYGIVSFSIAVCFLLSSINVLKGLESIYLSIILLIDSITYIVYTISTRKTSKKEK